MKVRAGRPKDYEDILFLAKTLGFRSAREVFELHDEVFPQAPPKEDSFKNVCEILQKTWPDDCSLEGTNRYAYGSSLGDR